MNPPQSAQEGLSASVCSVMPWTRNTICKARCVIAEMRSLGEYVDSLNINATREDDPKELRVLMLKMKKDMRRGLMRGHWWKLRSLAKELPLALVLDTPGLRTIWRAWKRRKHSQNVQDQTTPNT